jgi:hypothetical protein
MCNPDESDLRPSFPDRPNSPGRRGACHWSTVFSLKVIPLKKGIVRPKVGRTGEVKVLSQEVFNSVSRRKLRRSDAGWGATGGENTVRRMTNAIRPKRGGEPAIQRRILDAESDRASGSETREPRDPSRWVNSRKRRWGPSGGWRRNVKKVLQRESGRPDGVRRHGQESEDS